MGNKKILCPIRLALPIHDLFSILVKMTPIKFTIIGSSNAIGLESTSPKHPIFIKTGVTLSNKSVRGMNVKGKQSKKSFLKHKFASRPRQFYILFLGPNGFRHRNFNRFLDTYSQNIRILIQSVPAKQLVVVLPLPRGHLGLHRKQMSATKEFGAQLVNLGIHVVNPYMHLPHRLRHIKYLFGKKDLKKKKYVHFSQVVRNKIYYLIGDKVRDIVNSIRTPDIVTNKMQNLDIQSTF